VERTDEPILGVHVALDAPDAAAVDGTDRR
jgi:hypothetical protein